MKNSNDNIGNQTHEILPQPTAPPHAPTVWKVQRTKQNVQPQLLREFF